MSVFCRSTVALGEAAYIAADQEDAVPDGLYWRITPGGAADLPAGPVLLRHIQFDSSEPVSVADASTGHQPEPGRLVTPDAPVLLLPRTPPGAIIGWAYVQGEGNIRVAAISGRIAVGGGYVELSARDREPYAVAGHDMAGLVVTGDGRIIESTFYALPAEFGGDVGDIPGEPQVHSIPEDAIPVRGYVAAGNAAHWQQRIERAAPYRSVPFSLTDPGGPWGPGDELDRVDRIARAECHDEDGVPREFSVSGWLHRAYEALGTDASGRIEGAKTAAGDPYRVVVTQAAAAALAVCSLDPGIARWLGRSGMLPHGVVEPQQHGLLVATVPLHVSGRLPAGAPTVRDAGDDSIYDDRIGAGGSYLKLRQEVQGWPEHPEFGQPDILLAHIPLPYYSEITPARPVQPHVTAAPTGRGVAGGSGPRWAPDRPRRWEQTIAIGAQPATTYALHGPIPRAPVAFRRTDPSPATLHPEIGDTDLAAPLLPGWDDTTGAATLSGSQAGPDGAQAVPVTWSLTLSDWIGRWGEAASTGAIDPPPPPAPAPPTIEAGLDRRNPPVGEAAASPGDVHVIFRVPPATLPGALPLKRIRWTTNGTARPALEIAGLVPAEPDPAALQVQGQFPAPPTVPGQHQQTTIKAYVEDSNGTPSKTEELVIDADDARSLRPPTVAPHMLAASRRAGDPNVSVTLTVNAPSDSGAYRFYLASESALRTAARIAPPGPGTRATRAQQLNEHCADTARQASMLALPEPVPVISGLVTARLEIPAGTVDILAVRAVPVTAEIDTVGRIVRDGVEAPFTSAKPAFVVVPLDDVPPTPELTLAPVGDPGETSTPITATVTVRGVQSAVLNRYAHEPIRARIVEASTDGDPWFWPQVATTPLTRSAADPTVFTAQVTIEVPAWSSAGLAVAVQYPPEDTVVPGADIIDEPEFFALGPQGTRIESPWGPISVPAWIQVEGTEPLISAQPDHAGGLRIAATGLPQLRPGTPTFRMHVYGSGGHHELLSETVTATDPELLLSTDAAGEEQQLLAALETPYGKLLTPYDITM